VYIESGTVLALAVDVDANVALKPGLVRLTQAHIAMANKLGSCTAPLAEGLPIERDEQFGDARLTSPRLKNLRWRNAATIQRWTTYAPDSALALSRGFRGIEIELAPAGLLHARFWIVGNNQFRDAAEELEGAHMRSNPAA
jgi:hypothetical protein